MTRPIASHDRRIPLLLFVSVDVIVVATVVVVVVVVVFDGFRSFAYE